MGSSVSVSHTRTPDCLHNGTSTKVKLPGGGSSVRLRNKLEDNNNIYSHLWQYVRVGVPFFSLLKFLIPIF